MTKPSPRDPPLIKIVFPVKENRKREVRRAIAHAIDRDEIIKIFRGGSLTHHRVMNGPFPPETWATPTAPPGRRPRSSPVMSSPARS